MSSTPLHVIRFRIRNILTGAYIHLTLTHIAEFCTYAEALAFIRRNKLNENIYLVEAVKNDDS